MAQDTGTVYSAVDYTDFAHTGPTALAGRYMRLFWQPVGRVEDLQSGRSKPIRIMSEDFTLYRGESGIPHMVAFRCAHRGTQLNAGWVEDDCIRCFYHGWKYDGSGQCVEQPAEEQSYASKIKIRSYPVEEYLGLIFAYLGEGNPPQFPRYPDYEGVRLAVRTYTRHCNYFQHLENLPDPVHTAFVHGTRWKYGRGNWQPANMVKLLPCSETEWGYNYGWVDPDDSVHVISCGMPDIQEPSAGAGRKGSFRWKVPIDDEHHMDFMIQVVTDGGESVIPEHSERAWAETSARANELATGVLTGQMTIEQAEDLAREDSRSGGPGSLIGLFQDAVAQVGQGVIWRRDENEHLGRSDTALIMWRKLWERELRALAEGRDLKQWVRPPGGVAGTGTWAEQGKHASLPPQT